MIPTPETIRVLLVEDNPTDALIVRDELGQIQGSTFLVTQAERLTEALAELEKNPFHVVLLDLNLPDSDGFETFSRLRAAAADVPIVVLSGRSDVVLAVKAVQAGAQDYLVKGHMEEQVLARAMRYAIERKRSDAALRMQSRALETAANAIFITDALGKIEQVNPAFTTLTGFSAAEVLGKNPRLLKSDKHPASFYADLWHTILAGRTWRAEITNQRKDGGLYEADQTITPFRSENGVVTHFIGIMNDVSARNRAEASLRLFRTLVDQSNDILEIIDPESGQFLDVNERGCVMLGLTKEEYLAKRVSDLDSSMRPADWERFQADIALTGVASGEGLHRHKDGHDIPIEFNAKWVQLDRRYIVTVVRDITARKRAENVLAESERRSRDMLENVNLIALTLDAHGLITFCNSHFLKVVGWSRDEIIGADWFSRCLPVEDQTTRKVFFDSVASGTFPAHYDNSIRTKSGEIREITWNSTIERGPAGEIIGIASIAEDVTDRRQSEVALRTSEDRFRQVVENIHEVFWLKDVGGNKMLYVSPGFEAIWGQTCASLYQNAGDWLSSIHPADRERMQLIAATRQTERGYDETYRIVRPDQSVRWIRDRAYPIRETNGAVTRVVGTAEDITDYRHLEEKFKQTQKMEAIGTLAGGIAHDFNNILSAISGYTELSRMALVNQPKIDSHLGNVLQASRRATALVRQILTFSRRQEFQRKPILLRPLVEECLTLLRATLPATIVFDTVDVVDTPTVLADSSQVHQVLMNLGTNASHAMRDGTGRLEVKLGTCKISTLQSEAYPDLRPGPFVCLSVTDTGCGMDEKTLGHIFEPFFTTKPIGEGTGLGLSVVHGIMQSHDGAVMATSQPGVGSVFSLYFPVHGGLISVDATATPFATKGQGERILYIDDEAPLADLGQKILEQLGYHVDARTDAQDALNTLRGQPADAYDLVITDQMMPGLMGTSLAEHVHAIRPELPIILVTGFMGTLTADSVRALGIKRTIVKPLTVAALGGVVGTVLAEARLEKNLPKSKIGHPTAAPAR